MGLTSDPEQILRQATEAGKGIRFGRGVVGKTGHAVIAVLGVWGVIVWRIGPNLQTNAALISGGFIATVAFGLWTWATQRFAERNPGQALLEGAEFIEYKKFEAESKGLNSSNNSLIAADSTPHLQQPFPKQRAR